MKVAGFSGLIGFVAAICTVFIAEAIKKPNAPTYFLNMNTPNNTDTTKKPPIAIHPIRDQNSTSRSSDSTRFLKSDSDGLIPKVTNVPSNGDGKVLKQGNK